MPASPESETPSGLIDAKIEELDDWRGEMLSRIRRLTDLDAMHVGPLESLRSGERSNWRDDAD